MPEQPVELTERTEASALAELALCENLSQTSGWAARWSAQLSGADGALLWAPDAIAPLFLCIGGHGDGTRAMLRRSAPREGGLAGELVADRGVVSLEGTQLSQSQDPLLLGLPPWPEACVAIPLEAEDLVVGILILLFRRRPVTQDMLGRLAAFLHHATPALGRALRAERKTVGMLHAIERLTNLYDLSKAFGSTIDLDELAGVIARKAADFASAEVASLWKLDTQTGEVVLAATAVNENYDVEAPPPAVGASVVGDLLAQSQPLRRNRVDPADPLAQENPDYPVRSILALALFEDEQPVGALVVTNKRGRHPEFGPEDEELLGDLARQAVRALHNARQYEAEKKVQELDALLAVSREITATLDLDKVLHTIVNATSALISYDRCAIGILQRGKMRLGAISGSTEVDRKDPDVRRLEDLLQWIFFSGSNVSVTQSEDGSIEADRPETEEKFRAVFQATGLRSFYGVLLSDEEGKLGALAFESKEPLVFDEETQDLLQILVNQATVAVRNAQLYQQVPLAGFWKPLLEKRRRLREIPQRRRRAWGIGVLLATVLLVAVPWRLRISGPARIAPGQRVTVAAGVDGIVKSVLHREGDHVEAGDALAVLRDESYQAELAEAGAALEIAESDMARHQERGNAAEMFAAQSRRDELRSKIALAQDRLSRTQIRSPIAGVIVTPHIEQRVGQFLTAGSELCVVADAATVTAEVAVPEGDATLLRIGQTVSLKMNPYPTHTFRGDVTRVGAELREEGDQRFVIAETRVTDAGRLLRAGMLGRAKVAVGNRRLVTAIFRKPARYLWLKLWPLLP
jgi:RND family efflux transporter MFP subunit